LRGNFWRSRERFNCNSGTIETAVSHLQIFSVEARVPESAVALFDSQNAPTAGTDKFVRARQDLVPPTGNFAVDSNEPA
jgi:hypothetical protein